MRSQLLLLLLVGVATASSMDPKYNFDPLPDGDCAIWKERLTNDCNAHGGFKGPATQWDNKKMSRDKWLVGQEYLYYISYGCNETDGYIDVCGGDVT
jgi:hypothetical protein